MDLKAPENPNCKNIRGAFEVRYGFSIGQVKDHRSAYDFWGQIDDDGHLDGLIGQLGVRGATASVKFEEKTATGSWESKGCGAGTLTAIKQAG